MDAVEKKTIAEFIQSVSASLGSGYRLNELRTDRQAHDVVSDQDSLDAIAEEIKNCTACRLAGTRNCPVPGEGSTEPVLLVIGEGPGAEEDRCGRAFVGRAGQLLDKMLAAIGIDRNTNCFITNVVKCRPPQNRDPLPDETGPCAPFLSRQIRQLKPTAILAVGRVPAHSILNCENSLGSLRGHFHEFMGIPTLVTYHPSALLRNENLKRPAWEDLKLLRSFLLEHDKRYAESSGNMQV